MSDIHGTPPPCHDCGHGRREHNTNGGCSASDCLCLTYAPLSLARKFTEDPPSCIHGYSGNGAGCRVCEAADACQRTGEVLDEIATIIGTRFMDPPDGGDVSLVEQVRRMCEAAEATLAEKPAEAKPVAWRARPKAASGKEWPWILLHRPDLHDPAIYDIEPLYLDSRAETPVKVLDLDEAAKLIDERACLRCERELDPTETGVCRFCEMGVPR